MYGIGEKQLAEFKVLSEAVINHTKGAIMIFTADMVGPLISKIDLTQKELAEAVGCTEQSLTRWKKGRNKNKLRPTHRQAFIKIMKRYNLTPEDL